MNITLSLNVAVTYLLAPGAHPPPKGLHMYEAGEEKETIAQSNPRKQQAEAAGAMHQFQYYARCCGRRKWLPQQGNGFGGKIKVNINTEI